MDIIKILQEKNEIFVENPYYNKNQIKIEKNEKTEDARARLERFAPFIKIAFPETKKDNGLIESPLTEIPNMARELRNKEDFKGKLWLKRDSDLPVSGSIKARGGIYEVLLFAEKIALENGRIKLDDDYSIFASDEMKAFLSNYEIVVGSTGNLGLSIGIISRALGLKVNVHMSRDARQWKKDMLREIGCNVIEYKEDYEMAVKKGREEAEKNINAHFVDDENSMDLFYGYSVSGERLKKQLEELNIKVDEEHPLFLYLPCGVGGGPGGVAFGAQNAIGPNVHCIFVEPVQAPCMLLSIMTNSHGKMEVKDIGLTGATEADGLAVARASESISKLMSSRLDGFLTVDDKTLYKDLQLLMKTENLFIEPSAASSFSGPSLIEKMEQFKNINLENSNHIIWATGGGMVPEEERIEYLNR